MNKDRAFEVEQGVIVTDENGNEGPFYTGGSVFPFGLDLPQSTIYVQNEGSRIIVWQKFGAGVNDWRNYPALDISFDDSGSDELTATNLQAAVQALANRNFGKNYAYAGNDIFTTTSTTYVDALTFSGTFPAGTYRIAYSYGITNSKENTNSEVRVLFDGVEYDPRVQSGSNSNRVTGFEGNISFGGGLLNASIQVRVTAGNGNAIITSPKGELWRLS